MIETQQAQQQAAINVVESLELVRCLLRVSIFHTCYLRGIFPEKCFKEVSMSGLDGMVIKMLLPGKNKDAMRLVEWVEHGLHDAVEKGYLESMTFGLSRDKEQTDLVEQFQYKFAYDEADGMTMADSFGTDVVIPLSQSSQADMKTVKYQIVRMMRMLIQICTTLGALPEERYVFMKLTYNETTPGDYEPPFFRTVEEDNLAQFPSRPFSLNLGAVKTNFHEVCLSVRSVCDPIDEGGPEHDKSEGQGQTSKHDTKGSAVNETSAFKAPTKLAFLADTAIEVGISNFPVATNGTSAEDEPLLKDMMNFCLEGGTSTIDLAGAKARFADADIASLERCFDTLVIKGTLQAVPNHTGTYLVNDSSKVLGDVPTKGSEALGSGAIKPAAMKPAKSVASKYRSQYADVNQEACGAGSCRTSSIGPRQARGKSGIALSATSESMLAGFPDTQNSNREGRKRKASHAEEPIYQHLGEGKIGTRLHLLKMQRNT